MRHIYAKHLPMTKHIAIDNIKVKPSKDLVKMTLPS